MMHLIVVFIFVILSRPFAAPLAGPELVPRDGAAGAVCRLPYGLVARHISLAPPWSGQGGLVNVLAFLDVPLIQLHLRHDSTLSSCAKCESAASVFCTRLDTSLAQALLHRASTPSLSQA
eukprot:scaffold297626_cov19-Tisochrysis_lutea.AAC.2